MIQCTPESPNRDADIHSMSELECVLTTQKPIRLQVTMGCKACGIQAILLHKPTRIITEGKSVDALGAANLSKPA